MFPTRFDTNRSVQSQMQANSLRFWIEVRGLVLCLAKTKALISVQFREQPTGLNEQTSLFQAEGEEKMYRLCMQT